MPIPIPSSQFESALTPSNPPTNPSQQPFVQKKQIGDLDFTIEFNDSVLSTKGWTNPRYEGCEIKTQVLNQFTIGDISYGKSFGVQKYTRNIYVGNNIIDLKNTNDDNLIQFPSASYVNITKALTVDNLLGTTEFSFEGNNLDSKRGFYRSFLEDFPPEKDISLILLDNTVPNYLEDTYNVYFSDGRLLKTLTVTNTNNAFPQLTPAGLRYDDTSAADGDTLSSDNMAASINSEIAISFTTSSAIVQHSDLDNFFDKVLNNRNNSPSENRFFLTIGTTVGDTFRHLTTDLSHKNRRAYKTYELQNTNKTQITNHIINLSDKFSHAVNDYTGQSSKFSYIISKLNDSIPSLLIKMNSETQLPSGIGDSPFIVIPHNLHPFIKDNLIYILSTAGVDIGSTQVPKVINRKNQNLI
jgi:hypothetical protein